MRCRPGRQIPEILILLALAIAVGPTLWWVHPLSLTLPAVSAQPPGWGRHVMAFGFSLLALLVSLLLLTLVYAAVSCLGDHLLRAWERFATERALRKRRWKNLG